MSYIVNDHTVDITHAAGLMGVGHNRVRQFIESGELPAAQIGSGYVMLKQHVLDLIEREIRNQTAARMRKG